MGGPTSEPAPVGQHVLRAHGIVKDYGNTRALSDVTMSIGRGQIHGLLGANGAGKSTFIKLIAGLQMATAGHLELAGEPFAPGSPAESLRAGIRVAHQELAVVPNLSVRQNLALGARFRGDPGVDDYERLFEEWGIAVPMNAPMIDLAPALQAAVSLSRSLVGEASMILLDEPTASLGPHEVQGLFSIVRRRAAEGAAVVFVSHRLGEVSDLCGHATVLRNGAVVHSGQTAGLDEQQLAELIAPRAAGSIEAAAGPAPARPAVVRAAEPDDVPRLSVRGLQLQTAVADVSFDVRAGEVLGLAGLVGAGRTETMETLMGLRRVVDGEILLDGEPFTPRNAYDAVTRGVALVPEERAAQALFPERDIVFNCSSSRFRSLGRARGWLSASRKYEERTQELMSSLNLKAGSLRDSIMSLSGGNQQKVVLGRVLTSGLRLLLLDEPTRGVDVGARRDFQTLVRKVADDGVAVIYISSELAELSFCDRIQVMAEGRTTVDAPVGEDFDEDELTRLCFIRRTTGGSHEHVA